MMQLAHKRSLRVLDFDCECRPLSWYAGDMNSKEITAIAWKWIGEDIPSKGLTQGAVYLAEHIRAAGFKLPALPKKQPSTKRSKEVL